MKKYLLRILIIAFPYFFLLDMAVGILMSYAEKLEMISMCKIVFMVYFIIMLLTDIYSAYIQIIKKETAVDSVKINLALKVLQMPAILVYVAMLVFGLIIGVWGIGFIVVAISGIMMSVIISGISSIGTIINIKSTAKYSISKAWCFIVLSFIPIVDLIIAIIVYKQIATID